MGVQKGLFLLILIAGAWLGVKYLLPLLLPFLLGLALALCAQPAVKLGTGKLGLRRGLASALGVSLTLLLLVGLLFLLGALLFRELMELNGSFARVYNVQQAQQADAVNCTAAKVGGGVNG